MENKRIVLIIACMTSFITPFVASSVYVALPTINEDFAVTDQTLLGWVVTGFLLSAAIFVVPFGRIADTFGINVAIVYLGASIGPFLGGMIIQSAGWRVIYAGVTVYALLAAMLASAKIKDEWRCADFDDVRAFADSGYGWSISSGCGPCHNGSLHPLGAGK